MDVGGAITGEDLISGRKLSDNERLVRGAFAIVPGAGAAAGKALLKNMPALANVMKSAYKTVEHAGGSALKSTLENVRNLGEAHGDQLKFTLKHPVLAVVTSKTGQQTLRESAKFVDNALRPIEVRAVQTNAGNLVTGVERGLPSGRRRMSI
ncbi:pre-toxin TG domain-containing protein [Rummeliibacillus sp. BSL5]